MLPHSPLTTVRVATALALCLGLAANAAAQQPQPGADPLPTEMEAEGQGATDRPMFDTDLGIVLQDSDGDGFPDLTEANEGTNPLDAQDYPGSELVELADAAGAGGLGDPGFPAANCRSGYRQIGQRLCISVNVLNAATYANAIVTCRDQLGRVASYGDLRYLYVRTNLDAAYNPENRWIGNFVGDDTVLCGNRAITFDNDPDIGNFEGECNRFQSRNYWCAHDRQ